jgi:predicted acylesterase/phospholipase RssA
MQLALNAEFGGAYLEDLDVRFVPMTVELRADGSPRGCAVIGGTVGEAVRVSGIALGFFAPAERRGTRYVDGGVAVGLPANILPDFGADMVIACNSIMPPNGRDVNAILPADVGRWLRLHPFIYAVMDRFSDVFVGFLTTLRESARAGAEDADVYYEVSAEVTPFLSSFMWCALDRIRRAAAEARGFEPQLDLALDHWRRLRGPRRP